LLPGLLLVRIYTAIFTLHLTQNGWIFYEERKIEVETAHYIKGMHNLLGAHFDLQNYDKFEETLKEFEICCFKNCIAERYVHSDFRISVFPNWVSIS
jgi:hypothetical protein